MDLLNYLRKNFLDKGEEKYSKMIEDLKTLGVDSVSDLKFLDEETMKSLKSFTPIEIKKFIHVINNPDLDSLEDLLLEIFSGNPREKLKKIVKILNDKDVFARKDILNLNTNEMREVGLLSEAELQKIEIFIMKNNKDHYDEIMKERMAQESNPERLENVLLNIFAGTPRDKMQNIKKILNEKCVCSRKDVLNINTNELREDALLQEAEIAKIDEYLKENNKLHYDKIKEQGFKANPEQIIDVLKEIFIDTAEERLKEIFDFLKGKGIDTKQHFLDVKAEHLRKGIFFKDAEIKKIEAYLELKNKGRYKEVKEENKSDLCPVLMEIFAGYSVEKLRQLYEKLKNVKVTDKEELLILNTNLLKNNNEFNEAQIKKIDQFLEKNNENHYKKIMRERAMKESILVPVLKIIFDGCPDTRICEIEDIFIKRGITTEKDVLNVNTNKLRKEKNALMNAELLKLDNYIHENNECNYENIMRERKMMKSPLVPVLKKIFDGFSDRRICEIDDIFVKLGITREKDLLNINTNLLRVEKLLLDTEILRLDCYLQEKNELHYKDILRERRMMESILVPVLKDIFCGYPDERICEIEDIFKAKGITSNKDVLVINTNQLRNEDVLPEDEINKINNYLKENNWNHFQAMEKERKLEIFNPENLQHVLNKIFSGVDERRLFNIKGILRDENVLSGSHIFILDTNDLRKKGLLSEADLKKIEEYIRENNLERYTELKHQRKEAEDMRRFQFETEKRINERHCLSLTNEKKALLKDVSLLEEEYTRLSKRASEVETNRGVLWGSSEDDVKKARKDVEELREKLKVKNARIQAITYEIREIMGQT